jgi:hypothetical protein
MHSMPTHEEKTMSTPINRRAALAVAAVVVLGTAVSAAHAAVASQDAATPFRIVLSAHHEDTATSEQFPVGIIHVGAFTSGSPFCDSGTAADLDWGFSEGKFKRLFTCDDGSGSLTFWISPSDQVEHTGSGWWRIVDGTGRYAGLHGKATYRGENLSGDPAGKTSVFRVTAEGFLGTDARAPTLAVSTAKATKLRAPKGAYSVAVALALRDDVADNAVSYTVNVLNGRKVIATIAGASNTGTATTTLRVQRPTTSLRSIQLQVIASDPVGNETTVTRTVALPR